MTASGSTSRSRPFSPAWTVMVAVVCSLGFGGCEDSDGDGGGSSGGEGQDFGQLPIGFIPGQQDTPPVADPYADYGLSAIATLGGIDNMASWRADQASDEVAFQAIGLTGVSNQHWVNRPTFQQVIQFRRRR